VAELAGSLLQQCPQLVVMASSRERLGLRAERVYAVPPLQGAEAEALFLKRAEAVRADFEIDDHIAAVCRAVDGLPLAVELAAARVRSLSTRAIRERLGKRLSLLATRDRDVEERQRTLEATIAWSYELLDAEEQRAFRALSVFAGGCTLEAAEQVAGADLELIESLLDKSLLRHRLDEAGQDRYWMLETIREFAAERLDERGEREALAHRHAEWHSELAERLQEPMRDGDPDATARLTAEIDNVRSALERFARVRDARQGLRIVWGLWYFWVTRGLGAEGLRWARWAVAEAPRAPPKERAFGVLGATELFRMFGDPALALRLKQELVSEFRELGLEKRVASTLADMAGMLADAGEFDEARRLGGEALALRRRLGTPSGIAHALASVATVEFRAGDFTRARDFYEESIALSEEPSIPTDLAQASLMAGESARRAGDLAGAVPLLLRGLRLYQDLGERATFPELLQEIAAASTRHPSAAVRLLGASERLLSEIGVPRWDPDDYERTVARLRAELGEAAFEEAWVEGAALSEDEGLSLAARCLD
jgi:predicted ATPase